MSFFCLLFLDKKMTSSLSPYVNAEVERLTTNIVNKAVRKKMLDKNYGDYLITSGEVLSLDIVKLNQVKEEITDYVNEVLMHLDDASVTDYYLSDYLKTGKFKKIKHGILAENSVGSLRGSTLFGNIGPTVPIRLFFVGQVTSDIDIETKEYGINNVIVKVYLILNVKEQVMMPLASKKKEIIIREVLEVDMLKGEIPNYYTGISK